MGRIGETTLALPSGALLPRRSFARLLATLAAFPAFSPAQETTFRVQVKLVTLLVTVRNQQGDLVGSLTKDDFQIFDNDVPQQIAVFEQRTDQPLSVTLLVDTSASTARKIREEMESVQRFLKALMETGHPRDAAALYTFSDSITLVSSFTRRLSRLQAALKNIKGSGGTSLYDAILLASRDLERRDGRKVLLILSDGGDTTSYYSFHEALEAVQRADAVVYPILIVPIRGETGRNVAGENALTQFATGTGGKLLRASLGAGLDQSFSDILRELRTQYLLGYYPRNVPLTKDRFHRLRVTVARPGLQVSTRSGYYGESLEDGGGGFPSRSKPR